jgi:hypothetical protein
MGKGKVEVMDDFEASTEHVKSYYDVMCADGYCNEDYCSREYGFTQDSEGKWWCEDCGYITYEPEDQKRRGK